MTAVSMFILKQMEIYSQDLKSSESNEQEIVSKKDLVLFIRRC